MSSWEESAGRGGPGVPPRSPEDLARVGMAGRGGQGVLPRSPEGLAGSGVVGRGGPGVPPHAPEDFAGAGPGRPLVPEGFAGDAAEAQAGAPAALQVAELHVYYGVAHVLQGVELQLAGGVLSLVGRNGMGKTTLCNAIMGLLPARRGSIRVFGQEVLGKSPQHIAALGVGYVPQGRRVWPSLTVDEHLQLGGRRGPWSRERVYALFPRLEQRRRNSGGALSGGEQQMLAIGRALLSQPRLLVMDEPTEGLAPRIVEQVVQTLKVLADEGGLAVLLVEQNLGVATQVADEVAVMVNGRIARRLPAAALAADRALQQRLLGVHGAAGAGAVQREAEAALEATAAAAGLAGPGAAAEQQRPDAPAGEAAAAEGASLSAGAPARPGRPGEWRGAAAIPAGGAAAVEGAGLAAGAPARQGGLEEEAAPPPALTRWSQAAPPRVQGMFSAEAPPPTRWSPAAVPQEASRSTSPAASPAAAPPGAEIAAAHPAAASQGEAPQEAAAPPAPRPQLRLGELLGQTAYVAGTYDTKGPELAFIQACLQRQGLRTRSVDLSTLGRSSGWPSGRPSGADVAPAEVARHHPGGSEAVFSGDRGTAVSAMAEAFVRFILARRDLGGLIAAGGSGATALATPAMRALPVGVPKVMVSTVASGDVRPYVGPADIMMLYSVTDVAGLNRISERVLSNAAHALAGMVGFRRPPAAEARPAVGLSMFGVTTTCVQAVQKRLESRFDCLIFHATGVGGQSMEKLADSGLLRGILDITTTEIADLLVGGVLSAGPERMDAAIRQPLPYVASCGALDMVNFGALDSVPAQFRGRNLYMHNPQVTLMRTTPEENAAIGKWICAKLNQMQGPVRFLIPEGGVSALDVPGAPFHDPAADAALFGAIAEHFQPTPRRQLIRRPEALNDPAFADALADTFLSLLGEEADGALPHENPAPSMGQPAPTGAGTQRFPKAVAFGGVWGKAPQKPVHQKGNDA